LRRTAQRPEVTIDVEENEIEMPSQDGSVQLEERIAAVRVLMEAYAEAVAATPLAAKLIDHTWKQVDALRGLVRDGTFATYDHWWRSSSYSEVLYDDDDRSPAAPDRTSSGDAHNGRPVTVSDPRSTRPGKR
jgi:hypothetical protein